MITSRIKKSSNLKTIFSSFSFRLSLFYYVLISIILFSCEGSLRSPEVQKASAEENQLMLGDNQIRLANITTKKIEQGSFNQTDVITGRITRDEQQRHAISTRAAGRIVKLYAKESGVMVKKGMPLYTLYSEMLLTLQDEYLLAKTQVEAMGETDSRSATFLNTAIKKLILYGFTSKQMAALNDRKSIRPEITVYAPVSGVVTDVNAFEGEYVSEGSLVYNLARNDKLWVEAEIYPNETAAVHVGDSVTVRISTNEEIQTTVNFTSAGYNSNAHVVIMRVTIDNTNGKLKPGEYVQLFLHNFSGRALTVPSDAVLRNSSGAYLFVLSGKNTFQPRSVLTGIEDARHVEIISGISDGDTVVVSGAYLLYSEFVLKGAGKKYW